MKHSFLLLGTICLIFEAKWHSFIEKFCKLWSYMLKSKEKLKYWRREDKSAEAEKTSAPADSKYHFENKQSTDSHP